jgi:hypothetical protein
MKRRWGAAKQNAMLDPLCDRQIFFCVRDQFYKYSGCKANEMWGKSLLRPAVGLEKILKFYSYSGCKKDCMWGKIGYTRWSN